ncbi:MAG: toprim domain-containing protein [Pseudanabaena sp. ELA607]
MKNASEVVLATDGDRDGEEIACPLRILLLESLLCLPSRG